MQTQQNIAQGCFGSLGCSKTPPRAAQEPFGRSKTPHRPAPRPFGRSKTPPRVAQEPFWRSKALHRPAPRPPGRSKTPPRAAQEPLGRSKARRHCTRDHLKEPFKKTVSAFQELCDTSLCSLCSEDGYSQDHTGTKFMHRAHSRFQSCWDAVSAAIAAAPPPGTPQGIATDQLVLKTYGP